MSNEKNLSCLTVVSALGAVLAIGGGPVVAAQEPSPPAPGWKLVRTVSNPYGGTIDFVLIPEAKQRDREYYSEIADAVCADRASCLVNYWTDPAHVPKAAEIPVTDLRVMTARYEKSPTYEEPVLRLACWLFPNRTAAVEANCFVMPGTTLPPEE